MGISITVLNQIIERGDLGTKQLGRRTYVITDSLRRMASADAGDAPTPSLPREVRRGRA